MKQYNTKNNVERIYKRDSRTYDYEEMRDIYYELRDAIERKNQYVRLVRDFSGDKNRIYKKIDSERYNIYKIIDRLIRNGGCPQTNEMAIAFLESELVYNEVYNGHASYKKTYTNQKMSCYHQNQRDRIHLNKVMISKLRSSANL